MNRQLAVALLSGGLDSATSMAIAIQRGYDIIPLHVQYGQRHNKRELEGAQLLVAAYFSRCRPLTAVSINFPHPIKGSALTDSSLPVPMSPDRWIRQEFQQTPLLETGSSRASSNINIPNTYVPARNTILLGLAASMAEQEGADFIYVGFNAVDYSGYPDCRAEYVTAMNVALHAGMKRPVQIEAPLVNMTKVDVIRHALKLGVPLKNTWSCYNPQQVGASDDRRAGAAFMAGAMGLHGALHMKRQEPREVPCGQCDSCRIRAAAFAELGVADPALEVS